MKIKSANYVISSPSVELCPKTEMPEYAFIGRSNVGKSSLINSITNHSSLAKTSAKPGKTRMINHFLINEQWYLVDLPGYGFAGVSKADRGIWKAFIQEYLQKRENLTSLFVLIDVRLEPQKIDLEFINNVGEIGIAFAIVFTKADKVSANEASKNIAKFNKELKKTWEELPTFFLSSSKTKQGNEEILDFIEETNKAWKENKW